MVSQSFYYYSVCIRMYGSLNKLCVNCHVREEVLNASCHEQSIGLMCFGSFPVESMHWYAVQKEVL